MTTTFPPPPISVIHIDATHLELGSGAARQHISRGEVRNLKQYERHLADKTWAMNTAADTTRTLKAHADAQHKRATYLLEAAKTIEGGDRLITALTKLQDAANDQAIKAEELHKRTIRAAEACSVLTSNVATRYGDMYRAVVNSPLTVPAELRFYKG